MSDDPSIDQVRREAFSSMLAAEQRWRSVAEGQAAAYRQMLHELARALAGAALEHLKAGEPEALLHWTPADWRDFMNRELLPRAFSQAKTFREAPALPAPVPAVPAASAPPAEVVEQLTLAPRPEAAVEAPMNGEPGTAYAQILRALSQFQQPRLPMRFDQLGQGGVRWKRGVVMLFLLARFGLNSRVELGLLYAHYSGAALNSTAGYVRRSGEWLAELGFLETTTLQVSSPLNTSLALYRLTGTGRELAHFLGWGPVESEWERIDRLHEGARFPNHTLGLLSFGLYARARGYTTWLLPEVAGKAAPDFLIERDTERRYVEVELGRKEHLAKWRHLVTLQGHVALCASTSAGRERLVGDCKLKGFPGVATDLEMLKNIRVATSLPLQEPLWLEEWRR